MNRAFDAATLERFRQRLETRARQLLTTIERPADQTTAVEPDRAVGRLTRVDAVQAGYVSDALRSQMRAEFARVGRALRSIDEGTFGMCRSCGEALVDARLEAKPDATLCIQCAEERER